jgi:DNA polymerase-1
MTDTVKSPFILIDGNSFMHRAYNALPPLTSPDGFPTHALTGTINMINSIVKRFSPSHMVVVFDAKGKNFRHDIFPDYKGNRPPMDDDLRVQFAEIAGLVRAYGIETVSVDGVEADDVMATMAEIYATEDDSVEIENEQEVYISTSDKDMAQSVRKNILILDTKDVDKSGTAYNSAGVIEKYGVRPDQIVDYLSLIGDTADNIAGVYKCGEKTAVKWLTEYDSLAGIVANADNIKGVVGENLRAAIDTLPTTQRLITLKTDVVVPDLMQKGKIVRNEPVLFELLQRFGMFRLIKQLALVDPNAETISADILSDKFPTTIAPQHSTYYECHLTVNGGKDGILAVIKLEGDEQLYRIQGEDIVPYLRSLQKQCSEANRTFVLSGFRIKQALRKIDFPDVFMSSNDYLLKDVEVYEYLISNTKSKKIDLSSLSTRLGGMALSGLRDKYKLDAKDPRYNKMSPSDLATALVEEMTIVLKYFEGVSHPEQGSDDEKLLAIDLEMISILSMMETNGVKIDRTKLEHYSVELKAQIEAVNTSVYEKSGAEFNIASPKQVAEILFDKMEIPAKNRKTGEAELTKLADDYPIVTEILKFRQLSVLRNTFVDGIVAKLTSDNVVHATYLQTSTATARLSCEDPSLQNIPIRSEQGRLIREAFIPRECAGVRRKILALDFSQVELRILAHLSQDEALIRAFIDDKDIHKATAAEIFNVPLEDVTDFQRRAAKAINFGLIYGMGVKKLAEEIGVDQKEAKQYINMYFTRYPQVKPYFEEQLSYAQDHGYVKTIMGRRLDANGVNSANSMARAGAERSAKNASIQGSAADIMRLAMFDVFNWILENQDYTSDVFLIMQVHDELVFDLPEEKAEHVAETVSAIMSEALELLVPLKVDYKIADNWLDAH